MKKWLFSTGLLFLLVACGGASDQADPDAGVAEGGSQAELATPEEATSVAEIGVGPDDRFPASKYADLRIVTLLPRDAIPAIDNPRFQNVAEADEFYDPDELIIGVEFDDEARAYSVPLLSNHEIVNDTVGGVKIAVTW